MRILVLTSDAFGGHGGTARFNRDLLTALCAHSDCAEVVAIPRFMPNPPESLPEKLVYITSGLGSKWKYIITVLRVVYANPKFDLMICGHIHLLSFEVFLRWWIRAPIILVIYGIDAWNARKGLLRFAVKTIDAFVSISQVTKERFLGWAEVNPNKGFLLPNSVDPEQFGAGIKNQQLADRYGIQDKTIIMSLGRLVKTKGMDKIVDIMPDLISEISNIIYLIVGDGIERENLEQKTKILGIESQVVFTGNIPESEKAEHYRLADVYVMPSHGEGFGFVFLEAMACGIAVVASRIDGSRDAVRDGKLGILVDPNDPVDIKQGILEALKRPKGVIPEGLEYFFYNQFEQRCHQIIDQVLAKAG